MSGLLTKAEIAQGSTSLRQGYGLAGVQLRVFDSLARSFETRSRPRFLAATLATLPSMSLFPKAPFLLAVYNPSVSLAIPHERTPIAGRRTGVNSKAALQFHCSTQEAQIMVS
jgi:hypothetical protein